MGIAIFLFSCRELIIWRRKKNSTRLIVQLAHNHINIFFLSHFFKYNPFSLWQFLFIFFFLPPLFVRKPSQCALAQFVEVGYSSYYFCLCVTIIIKKKKLIIANAQVVDRCSELSWFQFNSMNSLQFYTLIQLFVFVLIIPMPLLDGQCCIQYVQREQQRPLAVARGQEKRARAKNRKKKIRNNNYRDGDPIVCYISI